MNAPARKANTVNPTKITYEGFDSAYDYFNHVLFENALPRCLVTLQRKNKSYGYFAGQRFGTKDGSDVRDEIALNPQHFAGRTVEQVLSTLAHEQVHLWQHHFGKPSRAGYHDREWAAKMVEIGLQPSDTGQPGGKTTGQHMTHYIIEGGAFAQAAARLIAKGWTIPYVSLWDEEQKKTAAKKRASKTKFVCGCCGAAAWGKPTLKIVCGECDEEMKPEAGADADQDETAAA
jgi:SprT-like family